MTRTARQDQVDAQRQARRARAEELRARKGADLAALAESVSRPEVPQASRKTRTRVPGKGQMPKVHRDLLVDLAVAYGLYQQAFYELQEAQVKALNAGVSQSAIARALGVSPQAVQQRVAKWREDQDSEAGE